MNLMETANDTVVQKDIVAQLTDLLRKGNAHVSLDDALTGIPFDLLGEKPTGLPYSTWQLTEHIRITQWDILEFSKSSAHQSPKWPDEYWPGEVNPPSATAWKQCLEAIRKDRESFIDLLQHAGETLYTPFTWGDGQTLLKEALVIADHNSYHAGQIVLVRKLLNAWN